MSRTATHKKVPKAPPPVIRQMAQAAPVDVAPNGHKPASLAFDELWKVLWENMPMPQAQQAYAVLQDHYQKAGRILNERATPRQVEQFHCFMAGTDGACKVGKIHDGKPVFIDLHYKAPKGGYKDQITGVVTTEGLNVPVKICSERCYHLFNAMIIAERRARMNPEVNG